MLKNYISIILPTKDEEDNLKILLPILSNYTDELIVIDGHSIDRSVELAKQFTPLVFVDLNSGKGAALRQAVLLATKPVIVFIDADNSHNPADIPKLIYPIFTGQYDHITGSRSLGGSDEFYSNINHFIRMIGSQIITLGINLRFSVKLTDSQNGFRAIRKDLFLALDLSENITTIEQEMIMKTLLCQCRIGEVATHEFTRTYGKSKILLRKVFLQYLYCWVKLLFRKRRPRTVSLERLNQDWENVRKPIFYGHQIELENILSGDIQAFRTLNLRSKKY